MIDPLAARQAPRLNGWRVMPGIPSSNVRASDARTDAIPCPAQASSSLDDTEKSPTITYMGFISRVPHLRWNSYDLLST
jgi:hypothetical protein